MLLLNEFLIKLPSNSYKYLNQVDQSKKVSEIMVMASPDINNWIIPKELILTSFYGLNIKQQKQLIIDLKNHHASGLMVKRNEYLKKVPNSLIILSQQLDLPLIEIYDIKYREIINTFEQLKRNTVEGRKIFIDQYWNQILRKFVSGEATLQDENLLLNKLQIMKEEPLRFISLKNSDIDLKTFKNIMQIINVDYHSVIVGFLKNDFYILINEKKFIFLKKELLKNSNAMFIAGRTFLITNINTAAKDLISIRKLINCLNIEGNFINYEDLGINKLFIDLPTNTLIRSLLTNELQQFWKEKPDLCKSLKAYFDANLNVTKAAKSLFIHPKSLTYRLHKIGDSLNVNLNNTNEIINLSICLNLLYLQQKGFFIT